MKTYFEKFPTITYPYTDNSGKKIEKESADLSPKVIKNAIVKALEKIDDMATLQDILTTVAETGEYEDLGHCEQCGDWITSYTLEI